MKNNQAAVILYAGIALFLIYNLHSYGAPRGEVTAETSYLYNTIETTAEEEKDKQKFPSHGKFQFSSTPDPLSLRKHDKSTSPSPGNGSSDPRVWVTMGLCWGENAQVLGKEKFPYSEAALRSVQLWHRLTPARVVLTIVHTGDSVTGQLEQFRKKMEGFGADVSLVRAEELSCVTTSQLVRILAQVHHPVIRDEDIVITADVDAFIMTPSILKPLKKKVKVWIWRYELSYANSFTFMMPFIGARSNTWREMIHYNGSLKGMVDHYMKLINISSIENWDIDQDIVTYAILTNKMCSLQKSNKVWGKLNLEAAPFRDSETCWHGSGVNEDCNNGLQMRNAMIKYQGGGCKWWHFYPYETVKELEQKFQEIMNGNSNNFFLDKLISGVKSVQKNVFQQFFSKEKLIREDPSGELEIWTDHKT